jgi:tetrapyrrole methylase family protein / MazG family protein
MESNNQNWISNLQTILQALQIGNDETLVFMPAAKILSAHHTKHSPDQGLLVYGISENMDWDNSQQVLMTVYPENHNIKLVYLQSDGKPSVEGILLKDLGSQKGPSGEMWLFIPSLEIETSFQEFQEIIGHLRAPNGCPWDREQTHLSLRNNLLEEAYETLEAIDREDVAGMQEEFGDLLLQIVLHAQIAAEAGEFRMEDVIAGIYRKIIRRHPHVFGDVDVEGVKGVLQNWEKLKEKERSDNGTPEKGLLDGVPVVLPSLTQAQELQDRAARVGFDWPTIEPVWDKVMEELDEVRQANSPEEVEKELGDLLFAVVNLIRWYKVDSESALRGTNQKFRRRFKHIEKSARKAGQDLQSMTLDEMDGFWNEAKGFE